MVLSSLGFTEQGFLCCAEEWTAELAEQLALQNHIALNQAHWEVLYFMREYYLQYKHLPNMRLFVKAVAKQLGPDKGNSLYLHELFGETPLKTVCKLAGLPKPPTCL